MDFKVNLKKLFPLLAFSVFLVFSMYFCLKHNKDLIIIIIIIIIIKLRCFLNLLQVFDGNQDSNTIVKREIMAPAVARTLLLLPSSWHNNIALRIEVYGCNPGRLSPWIHFFYITRFAPHPNCISSQISHPFEIFNAWRE